MNNKQKIILIVSIVLGIIIIVVASILIAAAVYGKSLKVHTSTELDGINEEMRNILYYASIVGNSHNTQLWNLKISKQKNHNNGEIEIRYNKDRTLNVVDPNNREAYLSIGHYIENLIVLLKAYGYEANISYPKAKLYNKQQESISSPISFIQYAKKESFQIDFQNVQELLNLIEKRHSNKGSFKKDQIQQNHYNILKEKFGNYIHIYSNGDSNFNYIKDNSINAVKSQSSDQRYRDELAEWLRFSNKESNEKLDGINADMMGFHGLKKGFYYMTIHRKTAKGKKFANQGISTAKKQLKNCGFFILITGEMNNDGFDFISQIIEIGRMSQRIWFECTRIGISLQPFSAILEVDPYKSQIQKDFHLNDPIQMIFRSGYSKKYGSNIKLRRNLKDYIEVMK